MVVDERKQTPYFVDSFIDVEPAVSQVSVAPAFIDNPDLTRQIPGWPKSDHRPFCRFRVPAGTGEFVASVHAGMGRGISSMWSAIGEIHQETGNDRVLRAGDFGVYDKLTGFFYTCIGTKGNGPTANEGEQLEEGGEWATFRLQKRDPWGLVVEGMASKFEGVTLEVLARLGFRVGRVIETITLDGGVLAWLVDPIYAGAGHSEYSIASELGKVRDGCNAEIMVRLGTGVRADVLMREQTDVGLVEEGLYAWASEIAKRGSVDEFMAFYTIPTELRGVVERVCDYNYSEPLNRELAGAYMTILSFLCCRNYCLQDEYNARFPLSDRQIRKFFKCKQKDVAKYRGIGPIMLNYKPGDWDVGGSFFDVDVFPLKMKLAAKNGLAEVRRVDFESLCMGLSSIADKIDKSLGIDVGDQIARGLELAQRVSGGGGFLPLDVQKQIFYSEEYEYPGV